MPDEIEETAETEVEVEAEEAYTSAENWPEDTEIMDLDLPSGAKVRVEQPAVAWLALTGRVPAHLVAIQKHHMADGKSWTSEELDKALDWLVCASFVKPKVALGRRPGCRAISTISLRDKETVVLALKLHTFIGVLG
jgi:hypothetical protein